MLSVHIWECSSYSWRYIIQHYVQLLSFWPLYTSSSQAIPIFFKNMIPELNIWDVVLFTVVKRPRPVILLRLRTHLKQNRNINFEMKLWFPVMLLFMAQVAHAGELRLHKMGSRRQCWAWSHHTYSVCLTIYLQIPSKIIINNSPII